MEKWFIKKKAEPKKLGHYETIFTLTNGYLGYRGTPAFAGETGNYGFYIAGIYNKTFLYKEELVNLPPPFYLRIKICNNKIDFSTSKIIDFYYILDIKHGILKINYILKNNYQKILVQEERIAHIKYKQILFEKIKITPLNFSLPLKLFLIYDLNKAYTIVKDKKVYHLKKQEFLPLNNGFYMETCTTHSKIKISQYLSVLINKKQNEINKIYKNKVIKVFNLNAGTNEPIELKLFLSSVNSKDVKNYKFIAINIIKNQLNNKNFIKEHKNEFVNKWKIADVKIKGDEVAQKYSRYNIFNLISLAPYKKGISIGAKGLHGEGYKGHIFWDTEIYLFPFYLLTDIKIAENILFYRLERFRKAKEYAKKLGYKGCRFPWESALTGEDVTPDGCDTLKQEHIILDIAFAILHYINISTNKKFIKKLMPILTESVRYFSDRIEFDKIENKYVLNNVIGPDEFHHNVNNNFYTNYLIKKLLENVLHLANVKKIKISQMETKKWLDIKEKIKLPFSQQYGFHEQFDGYFKLREVKMKIDKEGNRILHGNLMKIYNTPEAVKIFGNTKLIKQADVIMAYCLFFNDFDKNVIKNGFLYYNKKTTHGSSLSRAAYAIVGSKIGEIKSAYIDFLKSAKLDLNDLNNNAGIHAASMGGVYNILINGFAGVNFLKDGIEINPHLPFKWKNLKIQFYYKRILLKIDCYKNKIIIQSNQKTRIRIIISNKEYILNKKLGVKI